MKKSSFWKYKNTLGFYTSFLVVFFVVDVCAQNSFIENKGQFPKQVKAKITLPSGALFIEEGKLIYSFYSGDQLSKRHNLTRSKKEISTHTYFVSFLNHNDQISTELKTQSKYYENYFLGEKKNWATSVSSYKQVLQKNIYNGIDVLYYIKENQLKYDIVVSPKGNVKNIKLKYEGAEKIILKEGHLNIFTTVNTVKEHKPYAYQIINGLKKEVECEYVLNENKISFYFPEGYEKKQDLIIDPVLEFSTYSGSTIDNFGYTATYDNLGYLYSGSTSFGVGYPVSVGAYQTTYANSSGFGTDITITKYDTTGSERIYSTYLGGNLDELPHSMIVSSTNELFVYGTTASSDFPTTPLAFQPNFKGGPSFSPSQIGASFPNGSDIFVSRLSADGGWLLASTFVGGTGNDGLNIAAKLKYNYADEVRGEIDIDQQNNVYIATCTNSSDFPTKNGFQNTYNGGQEGCVVKLDNQLTTLVWGTYLGGNDDDAIYSLAIDKKNDIYVTGGTVSKDFPTTLSAYQPLYQDSINPDAFITKISSSGTQILKSSYFGTKKYDQSYFVEVGKKNAVYLFGQTKSLGLDLVYNSSYSVSSGGQFIAVFDIELENLIRSTVFGTGKGTPDISPTAFLVDVCEKIYISGWGSNLGGPLSTLNLPVTPDAYQQNTDGNDIYLMVLDNELTNIIYATYFGGSQSNEHVDGGTSRFDKKGVIYQSVCAGCGGNSDFPIEPLPGAVSSTNNSTNCNNGVFKFNFNFPIVIADFTTSWITCEQEVSFVNLTTTDSIVDYIWDFGDGTTSNDENPTHVFAEPGRHIITLIANDNNTCNLSDTITKEVYILSNSSQTIPPAVKCPDEQVQIGLLPINTPGITYFWFPSFGLNTLNVSNPFCSIDSTQGYQLLISNNTCTDTIFQNVLVTNLSLQTSPDAYYCDTPIVLSANFSSNVNSVFWSTNSLFTDTLSFTNELLVARSGVFHIKVSDGFCFETDSVEVFTNTQIGVFSSDICLGDSVFVEVLNLTPSSPIVSYNWNNNSFETPEFFDFPQSSTWYVVEVIDADGCIVQDSVFVNVHEYPFIDSAWASELFVFKGEQVSLNIITENDVSWADFSNSNSTQVFFPEITKCYVYELSNSYNCIVKDSFCVVVEEVFCDDQNLKIPNAFSPNNDGVNDFYFVEDLDGIILDFKLEIFNRLGQKVFSSSEALSFWDGTFKGEKLNPQVFDFYLELTCIGEKKLFKKGNITLIR